MAEYTPGPWEAFDESHTLAITSPRRSKARGVMYEIIAWAGFDSSSVESWAERRANLHLIAASPDLYKALDQLLNDPKLQVSIGGNPNYVGAAFDRARAVLAKAGGE